MRLVLYPRIGRPGSIRVWLGAFGCTQPFAPAWLIDGQPAQPQVLQQVASIRANQLQPRAFYGVFEFVVPHDRRVRVTAIVAGEGSVHLDAKPLPRALVAGGHPLRVLLLSCFYCHQAEHNGLGTALQRIHRMVGDDGIDLTLLLGDQVYLDLPTFEQYQRNQEWLAERFEEKYVDNWDSKSDLAPILRAAPFVGIPDDHEYWNNSPEAQPWMDNTWTPRGRVAWRAAAKQMFGAFQAQQFDLVGAVLPTGSPLDIDFGAVRFFLLDTRTDRGEGASNCSTKAAIDALAAWTESTVESRCDVFVTGQSLFREKAGSVSGRFADYELPNYKDFAEILRALDRSLRPMLYVTGDVHWGRVACYAKSSNRPAIAEVIVTPSALVATPIIDQLKTAWGWLRGIFDSDPWPRHPNSDKPPDRFPTIPNPYSSEQHVRTGAWHAIPGDQVGLVEFSLQEGKLIIKPQFIFATQRNLPSPEIPPLILQDL